MPDIFAILIKRGKMILLLTLAATALALLVSLLRPKEYLATLTAFPANSALSDKARLFNDNIESLYPELGSPDELDRVEGTAKLDTVFLAIADSFRLAVNKKGATNSRYKAAMLLKKNTVIRRSAYGELKINVWSNDALMAANLANAILNKLNAIHQHVQNQNNGRILQRLKENLFSKQQEIDSLQTDMMDFRSNSSMVNETTLQRHSFADSGRPASGLREIATRIQTLQDQLRDYHEIIDKYELAIATSPHLLIPVEHARPAISPDRPKLLQTALFAFGASLIFSFLLALLLESRRSIA